MKPLLIISAFILTSCGTPISFSLGYKDWTGSVTVNPKIQGKTPVEIQK